MKEYNTVKHLTCAETAKLVRNALKGNFPNTKFSVRSQTYSMGAHIDVSYTDGPALKAVEAICDRFGGSTFDGMIDLKSYHDSQVIDENGNTQTVHFGADSTSVVRHLSVESQVKLSEWFHNEFGTVNMADWQEAQRREREMWHHSQATSF